MDPSRTAVEPELRIVGGRGGFRRGSLRLLEVAPFTVAGVALIILVPADPLLKLIGTIIVVSIALFRAVAEIRGYASWIQTVAPVTIALLIGLFAILFPDPVLYLLISLNCLRVALTGDRRILLMTLAASLLALLVPALVHPGDLAGEAAVWIVVLPMVSLPIQARSGIARAQADLRFKLAAVTSDLLTSDDSRQSIVRSTHELGGADIAILFESDPDEGLIATASQGVDLGSLAVTPDDTSVVGLSITGEEIVFAPFLESIEFDPPPGMAGQDIKSVISCPIFSRGRVTGALCAGWTDRVRRADWLSPEVVRILAGEVAVTLEHSDMMVRLAESATLDPLTGLPNRRAWNRLLRTGLLESKRLGKPISIAVLDLDYFKRFNDNHGHQAGDRMLREAAAAWKSALRRGDMLFRWGGEEFTVILPDCDPDQAIEVVERLRSATPGRETTSAGVATWNGVETAENLFNRTDAALYQAKDIGRNQTVPAGNLPG